MKSSIHPGDVPLAGVPVPDVGSGDLVPLGLHSPADIHRWRVLAASVVVVLCSGIVYSFSVFAGPLQEAHGWTSSQVLLAFAINGALAPVPMVLGGIVLDRGGARRLMITGAVLFGTGFALTGLATTPLQLSLAYGVVTAFGLGFMYTTAVSNTVRLFPDHRGLAAGLINVGVGGGTVIGAPVARAVIDSVGISAAFVRMGLVYGLVAVLAATFVRPAPAFASPLDGDAAPDGVGWRAMVRSARFWLLFGMLTAGLFGPVMLVSQLSGIGQSPWFGLSAPVAALFVSAFSACNAVGGLGWGAVSDRRGETVAVALLGVVAVMSFLVLLTVHTPVGFAIGLAGIGSCFGGVMGVFPALTMKTFGPRFQGTNYAIMFCGYSVASFVGPRVAGSLGAEGDFTAPFGIAVVVALCGLLLTVAFRRRHATERPRDPGFPPERGDR